MNQTKSSSWVHAGTPRRRTGDEKRNSQMLASGGLRGLMTQASKLITITAPYKPSNKPVRSTRQQNHRELRAALVPLFASHMLQAVSKSISYLRVWDIGSQIYRATVKFQAYQSAGVRSLLALPSVILAGKRSSVLLVSVPEAQCSLFSQDLGGPLCPASHTSTEIICKTVSCS